ncbi:MAG: RNA polymerase sigma factor [Acidimicrobiales bacterium]
MTTAPRPPHEGDLLTRARRGDCAAFVELVREHDQRLRGLTDRLLHDPTAIDDVLQRAYVTAYGHVGQARAARDPGKWLFRITYNTCIDALRQRKQEDTTDRPEATDDVRGALAGLPVTQRVALVLVDGEGFSDSDVAEILGVDPDKIASRLARARTVVGKVVLEQDDPEGADNAVRLAVQQLPVPDHGPSFWTALEEDLLAPAAAEEPPPVQVDEPGPITARHLAVDPKTSIVPLSLRRASNALLVLLAVAAAVLVIVSGLTLVRHRSDSGMPPSNVIEQSDPVGIASLVIPTV